MQVVILAGGLGTRISEETDYIPKPMVLIGGKPILWHIIKFYASYGFEDFIICGGYKIKFISNFFKKKNKDQFGLIGLKNINIKIVNTGKNSNTGKRILNIKKYLDKNRDFCLTYGDGLSDINLYNLIKFHNKQKSIATLTAVKPQPRYGKIFFKKNLISNFTEKNLGNENWINGGFFICSYKIFNYFKNKKNPIFESDVLTTLAQKKKLTGYKHHKFWYCMDTLRDKRHLNYLCKIGYTPWIRA